MALLSETSSLRDFFLRSYKEEEKNRVSFISKGDDYLGVGCFNGGHYIYTTLHYTSLHYTGVWVVIWTGVGFN